MTHAARKAHQAEEREWHPRCGEQHVLMQRGTEEYVMIRMGRRLGGGLGGVLG